MASQHARRSINDLPNELLLQVFSYIPEPKKALDKPKYQPLMWVSRRWYNIAMPLRFEELEVALLSDSTMQDYVYANGQVLVSLLKNPSMCNSVRKIHFNDDIYADDKKYTFTDISSLVENEKIIIKEAIDSLCSYGPNLTACLAESRILSGFDPSDLESFKKRWLRDVAAGSPSAINALILANLPNIVELVASCAIDEQENKNSKSFQHVNYVSYILELARILGSGKFVLKQDEQNTLNSQNMSANFEPRRILPRLQRLVFYGTRFSYESFLPYLSAPSVSSLHLDVIIDDADGYLPFWIDQSKWQQMSKSSLKSISINSELHADERDETNVPCLDENLSALLSLAPDLKEFLFTGYQGDEVSTINFKRLCEDFSRFNPKLEELEINNSKNDYYSSRDYTPLRHLQSLKTFKVFTGLFFVYSEERSFTQNVNDSPAQEAIISLDKKLPLSLKNLVLSFKYKGSAGNDKRLWENEKKVLEAVIRMINCDGVDEPTLETLKLNIWADSNAQNFVDPYAAASDTRRLALSAYMSPVPVGQQLQRQAFANLEAICKEKGIRFRTDIPGSIDYEPSHLDDEDRD